MFGHLENPATTPGGNGYQVGYLAVGTPRMRIIGNTVSYIAQLLAFLWMVVTLWKWHHASAPRETRVVVGWALIGVMLLILAPQTGIDYQMLAMFSFSAVVAALWAFPEWLTDRWIVLPFAGAVLLVANIVPRSIIVRLYGVRYVLEWSGYHHLTPLEGFSYYGYPLIGLLLLVPALVRVEQRLAQPGHDYANTF
jgi:hypothetical protein